jgi:hypothetical protein
MMLIAKVYNGYVVEVNDTSLLFPETSFPQTGPTDSFMTENSCMFVNSYIPFDQNTQKLVSVDPYIQADDETHWVYTVAVEPLTPEELAQREEVQRQGNKTQAESLLQATDWTATVDINNPEYSDPYLGNQNEFLAYRSAVRKIAINPPVVVDSWPAIPTEVWVDVE